MERLLAVMARLRDPEGGCPWDLEQSFETIAPYTLEEAYEVAEAIRRGDMEELREELGDLLLQVVYHARMAEEAGAFDFAQVAEAIAEKMIARHPHVFGQAAVADAEAQTANWEAQKARERAAKAARAETGPPSVLDGIALALPAATRAAKLQRRAARVGFDWNDTAGVFDKLREEIAELEAAMKSGRRVELAEEIGDLQFTLVNLARKLDLDPEETLRAANAKFERRFRSMERSLEGEGRPLETLDLGAMETAWQVAKARLRSDPS